MNFNKKYSLYQRFGFYVKSAVNNQAFIPVNELLERFLKTTKNQRCKRQQDRYKSFIKNNAEAFNLSFKLVDSSHGKMLYVTSSKATFFKEEYKKYDNICYQLVQALIASPEYQLSVYDILKKLGQWSRSTEERIVKALKEKAQSLNIQLFNSSRILYMKFIKKQPSFLSENTPHRDDIFTQDTPHRDDIVYKEAKDKNKAKDKLKHPQGELREIFLKKLRPKTFSLMRELKRTFYDNIKVKVNERMLFRFAEWALSEGFDDRHICQVFELALLKRHADATDMGLNQGNPKFKFEMSSTVSLAKEWLLAKNPSSFSERWKRLKEAWNQGLKKSEERPQKRNFLTFNFWNSKPEKEENNEVEEFLLLRNQGYSENQIQLFQRFQEKTLPKVIEPHQARVIANIGVFLAEKFSENSKYKAFSSTSNHDILQFQGLSQEEKEEKTLIEKGYSAQEINIFQAFLKKELSFCLETREKSKIQEMGISLVDAFPEDETYAQFKSGGLKKLSSAQLLLENTCIHSQSELFRPFASGCIPEDIDDRDRKIIFAIGVLFAQIHPNEAIYRKFKSSDSFITGKTLDSIEKLILGLNGYQEVHIQLFNHFQEQGLSCSQTLEELKILASMGALLAERFPEESSYQKFNLHSINHLTIS